MINSVKSAMDGIFQFTLIGMGTSLLWLSLSAIAVSVLTDEAKVRLLAKKRR